MAERKGISQRDVAEVLAVHFHLDLSLGSVTVVEQQARAAVAGPVAQAYVQQQPVVKDNETGWRLG